MVQAKASNAFAVKLDRGVVLVIAIQDKHLVGMCTKTMISPFAPL